MTNLSGELAAIKLNSGKTKCEARNAKPIVPHNLLLL